ncbi:MAG: hypothetical protein WA393_09810, partial [Nitrososphaeraceae archaeon]
MQGEFPNDGTNTANVSITVNPVTPIITPPNVRHQCVKTLINTSALAAADADSDPLNSFVNSYPSNGTLSEINQTTHTLTYVPGATGF